MANLEYQIKTARERLDEAGGRLLDTVCRADEVLPPAGPMAPGMKKPVPGIVTAYTCGCGNTLMAELPPEKDADGAEATEEKPAVICLLCDSAWLMPRLEAK